MTKKTDTRGLTADLQGKQLRLFFRDGEVCDVKLAMVEVHEDCHLCEGYAGIIYDLISTNRPERYRANYEKYEKFSCWANFEDIERFETLNVLG